MKKFLYIVIFMLIIRGSQPYPVYAKNINLPIYGETAILIDSHTGQVLYEKEAHKKMYPASTTKVMTALLVLEHCKLDEIVTIDAETPFTEGSRIYLLEGEQVTVENLLYALLLESANDAAVALAKYVAGTTEEFIIMMNKRAKELGAMNTNFLNPNGLPDENHTTTAYDLALIAQKAMENKEFRKIVSYSKTYTIPATEKQETRYFRTRNRLMWDTRASVYYDGKYIAPKYENAIGIKTGYTVAAGNCLVAAAQNNGREVIAVILKSSATEMYGDARRLLDHGLTSFKNVEVIQQGELIDSIKITNGKSKSLNLMAKEAVAITIPTDFEEKEIDKEVISDKEIAAPVQQGEVIGKIIYSYQGETWGETDLVAEKDIEKKLISTLGDTIRESVLSQIIKGILILAGIYTIFIIHSNIRRKKRRIQRRKLYQLEDQSSEIPSYGKKRKTKRSNQLKRKNMKE